MPLYMFLSMITITLKDIYDAWIYYVNVFQLNESYSFLVLLGYTIILICINFFSNLFTFLLEKLSICDS